VTTIAEVREDMARVLANLSDWSVSSYIGDQVHSRMIKIARPAFDPRMVFQQTKAVHTFKVTAYAPRSTTEASEAALDALCELSGSTSLIATIQDGSLWSVTVDYAQVTNCGAVYATQWVDSTTEFLACDFDIEVVW
jgi:hypothetical protein